MKDVSLKQLIIDQLHANHLLSASQMLQILSKQGKKYNKTSVYRALENLLEENIICRYYFDEAQASYELREDHHTHLLCNSCGKVDSTECTYHHPKTTKGFTIDHHHLTLIGTCATCRTMDT